MKPLKKIVFGLLFLMGLLLPLATQAQDDESEFEEIAAATRTCPDDYYGFILHVRSQNTRKQYFKDFFTLSYCQLNDILELYDELDELRDEFRSAAFDCENTTEYKERYHKILMETYFVRRVQKISHGLLNEWDIEQIEGRMEETLSLLEEEMTQVFVIEEERVSKSELEGYFDEWVSKYEDRLPDYTRCEEGAWAELTEVWNDFIEAIEEIDFDVEVPKTKSLKEILVPSVETEAEVDTGSLGKSVLKSFDYFKKNKEEQLSEVEPEKTVSTLLEEEGTLTIEEALESLNESEVYFLIDAEAADRMARYQSLYGEGGGLVASNLQGILEELNSVVQETNTKDFPNVSVGASKVYDKQCN